MVDYGALPPEINSGRIYAGPGAGPLLAAAAAWSGLADDLQAAASGHRSVISALTGGPWTGLASASMLSAVSPFMGWLDGSAEDAARVARQASAAASAYEMAFAATVPPPVIAANRTLLAALVATNILGQNTPAIAATEAQYFEFWAQDAGAMYNYAGSSAAATKFAGLPEPSEVVDPGGVVNQDAAVAGAQDQVINSAVTDVASQVYEPVSDVLNALSLPFNGTALDHWLMANTPLSDMVSLYGKYLVPYVPAVTSLFQAGNGFGRVARGVIGISTFTNGLAPIANSLGGAAQSAGLTSASAGSNLGSRVGGVAAGLAHSVKIGELSVPADWTTANAVGTPGPTGLNSNNAVPVAFQTAAEGATSNVALAPPFAQFINGGNGHKTPAYGHRLTFMTRPPAAG